MHDGTLAFGPGHQVRHVEQCLQGLRLPRQPLRVPVNGPLMLRCQAHRKPHNCASCCCVFVRCRCLGRYVGAEREGVSRGGLALRGSLAGGGLDRLQSLTAAAANARHASPALQGNLQSGLNRDGSLEDPVGGRGQRDLRKLSRTAPQRRRGGRLARYQSLTLRRRRRRRRHHNIAAGTESNPINCE